MKADGYKCSETPSDEKTKEYVLLSRTAVAAAQQLIMQLFVHYRAGKGVDLKHRFPEEKKK